MSSVGCDATVLEVSELVFLIMCEWLDSCEGVCDMPVVMIGGDVSVLVMLYNVLDE